MPTSTQPTPDHDAPTTLAVETEWNSDNSNQVRLVAWQTQRVRRSKAFTRQRTRQLLSLYLMLLSMLVFVLLVFYSSPGSFLRPFLAGTAFLVVLGSFQIARGGRLSTPAALRLASALEKSGGVTDTSGRWRFRIDEEQAVWEWLDRGFRVSQATPHLDPPEEFDHTLMFSARGMPLGLVPLAALTPEQGRRVMTLCGGSDASPAAPAARTDQPADR